MGMLPASPPLIHVRVNLCVYPEHDDVIKWKHFPRNLPFVRGIHRLPVNSPHKGQWREALIFPLICAWITGWLNNGDAGDLRRHRAHYDVIEMKTHLFFLSFSSLHNRPCVIWWWRLFSPCVPSSWCQMRGCFIMWLPYQHWSLARHTARHVVIGLLSQAARQRALRWHQNGDIPGQTVTGWCCLVPNWGSGYHNINLASGASQEKARHPLLYRMVVIAVWNMSRRAAHQVTQDCG